jgi:hypothetical protein
MSGQSRIIRGWKGVDVRTDEYVLGQEKPETSALALNYRAEKGIREARPGMEPQLDFSSFGQAKKGGVYFPRGACGVIPLTTTDLLESFYVCSEKTTPASTGYHYTFTVEFWYKMDFHFEPFAMCRGILQHNTLYDHLHCHFEPQPVDEDSGAYQLFVRYFTYGDPPGFDRYKQPDTSLAEVEKFLPADGEWHHIAVTRYYDDPNYKVKVTLDGVEQELTAVAGSNNPLIGEDIVYSRANTTQKPFMQTHMQIGGPYSSMAEFRVWRSARTNAEIIANKDKELTGSETDLVCYAPLNDGTGKTFEEKVHSGRGYLTPQEPWVNEDNELSFTGARCSAFPSLRAPYELPKDSTPPVGSVQKPTNHVDWCENGAYDGGILFDKKLNEGVKGAAWPEDKGVWQGVAQIRVRLWQLAEGVIAGRLGLVGDTLPPGSTKYRLIFQGSDDAVPGTYTYYSTPAIVDESWIGVEKTITVFYRGDESGGAKCNFYVDSTEYNSTIAVNNWLGSGTGIDNYLIMEDDKTENNNANGGVGSNVYRNNLSLAFDLLFLRQWYDDVPDSEYGGAYDEDEFISNTWNVDQLPERYRVFLQDMSGLITSGTNFAAMTESYPFGSVGGTSQMDQLKYLVMPLHYETDDYKKNTAAGTYAYLYIDDAANTQVPDQDILVRRVLKWRHGGNDQVKLLSGAADTYKLTSGYLCTGVGEIFFNGALFSNLVTDLNSETFKHRVIERGTFEENTFPNIADCKFLRLVEAVVDDSPVQGIEKFDYRTYEKSKYYALWADTYDPKDEMSFPELADREKSIYEQRSRKPRWCVGPITATITPKVRGIYRYTSEDGKVNKLLVAAWSGLFELNEATNLLVPIEWGFMDRNGDVPVNFLTANNRVLIMDNKVGLKMNYLGRVSRMGVERPTDVIVATMCQKASNNVMFKKDLYGYVAQFVDTENDSFSGVIPLLDNLLQTVKMHDGTAPVGQASSAKLQIRNAYDYNIDHIRIYRTLSMDTGDAGAPGNLFLVGETGRSGERQDFSFFRDVWEDANLATNDLLEPEMIGLTTVPKSSKAMAYAFGRVFLLNNDDGRSSLTWSFVNYNGRAFPDVFPEGNTLILEGGETSEGTALAFYGSQLIAFKDDSLFRVYENTPGDFANQVIYRGVGAANQRCVVLAANALYHLDQRGLYRYTTGEPLLVSEPLAEYIKALDMSDKDKPFVLFDEAKFQILLFVPSDATRDCDRMIVYNIRQNTFTIDEIPEAACGYVDGEDIFLGLSNGHVVKLTDDVVTDVVDYSGTGAVT